MIIKPEHFRGRGSLYHPRCIKRWVESRGLSWQKFLLEGYEHGLLLELAPQDPDLLDLLEHHGVT